MLTTTGFDAERLHAYRRGRLRGGMKAEGFDAIVLLGATNVEYAGGSPPVADAMRMHYEPVVVIAPATGPFVVCTRFPEELASFNDDVVHPAIETEYPEGVATLMALLSALFPAL